VSFIFSSPTSLPTPSPTSLERHTLSQKARTMWFHSLSVFKRDFTPQGVDSESFDEAHNKAHDKAPDFAHKEVDIDDFASHNQPELILSECSYSLQCLAELLINNAYRLRDFSNSAEKSPLTVPQQKALARYAEDPGGLLQTDSLEDEAAQDTKLKDIDVLREYLRIFDDLLYLSALGNSIDVHLESKDPKDAGASPTSYWYWEEKYQTDEPRSVKLIIYCIDGPRSVRLKSYIGTLLNTLPGVFFGKYTCRMGGCKKYHLGKNSIAGQNIVCQVVPIALWDAWAAYGWPALFSSTVFNESWCVDRYRGKTAREVYEQEHAIWLDQDLDESTLRRKLGAWATFLNWLCYRE